MHTLWKPLIKRLHVENGHLTNLTFKNPHFVAFCDEASLTKFEVPAAGQYYILYVMWWPSLWPLIKSLSRTRNTYNFSQLGVLPLFRCGRIETANRQHRRTGRLGWSLKCQRQPVVYCITKATMKTYKSISVGIQMNMNRCVKTASEANTSWQCSHALNATARSRSVL